MIGAATLAGPNCSLSAPVRRRALARGAAASCLATARCNGGSGGCDGWARTATERRPGPVVGTAVGEANGWVFHWTHTLSPPPGDRLRRVGFEHWMRLADDGETPLNRFALRKLGFVAARASEVFRRRSAS